MRMAAAVSRRAFLALSGAAVATTAACTVDRAVRSDPGGVGSLQDVDHFVLLMQENRSFDHYLGSMAGVRGLRDDAFRTVVQRNLRDPLGIAPFRLDTSGSPTAEDLLVADPTHSWSAQHAVWNNGAMDGWMRVHAAHDGAAMARAVMGYYTRQDLPVHYSLAEAFTVCDRYFSSVLGPTGPNRLYWMSATLGADSNGGPVTGRVARRRPGTLNWPTFPERLQEAGVSWKVYNHLPARRQSEITGMLKYFRKFQDPVTPLHQRGLMPSWPADFVHDVQTGRLPSVSWIIPSYLESEHPDFPPAVGAAAIVSILRTLTANPAVWERSALIVSYDENGGFFDHVAPPTPPPGTGGEFVSAGHRTTDAIGLGFRVPCLVISPYTRGGIVSSQTFDHTSQLQLIGRRFGVDVPNLSTWRRGSTGDMASIFDQRQRGPAQFALPPERTVARMSSDALTQLRREQRERR